MRIVILGFVLMICGLNVCAQFSTDRIAIARIQKGKWKSAEEILRKAMRKDSSSATILYVFAWYYQSANNPAANADSAHKYNLKASIELSFSSTKE